MLRTQPPADFFSSGLVENSSRAESSTDSSSNDPGLNGPNPAVGRTMISVEGSPINSNRSTRAGIVSQTSQEATDNLLDSYYTNFHPAHPCALPRLFFKRRLEVDPLGLLPVLLVMQYIGSLYTPSTSYAHLEAQVQEALVRDTTAAPISAAYQVQALILYAIAAYWCDEVERGLRLLDDAISRAVNLGMNLRVFAAKYGGGDPILEESWRRTWWLIYITDAHTSGSTHVYPFRTTSITTSVELPCEEESYASGVCLCLPEHVYNFVNFRVEKSIPQPRTLCEYEMREFAEDDGREFSSFAELVGLVRSLSTVFSRGRRPDSDSASTIAADFDASMMGWRSLLVQSERRILQIDGTIDEHLFRATMLMNT